MALYDDHLRIGILLISVLALGSVVLFNFYRKDKQALWLLILSALLLRLLLAFSDPFLHDWDERFHALVSKHMIDEPFAPKLRQIPVLPYSYKTWCCNHIWVHKQPLFLWQMALSMKIFGVNVYALRLPAVLMGTISVWLVWSIGLFWFQDRRVAFWGAFLLCFSSFQISLISGNQSLDHNDSTFMFYLTAAIWAVTGYVRSGQSRKWAILTGVLIGAAILVKWLTAWLVFGGWGLLIVLSPDMRGKIRSYIDIFISFIISTVIAVPWQLYIYEYFPLQSTWESEYNRKHIFEVLDGQGGSMWYHIEQLDPLYGKNSIILIILGVFLSFYKDKAKSKISISFFSMVVILYAFFSIIVATKMPGFVYPVSALIYLYIGAALIFVFDEIQFYATARKLTQKGLPQASLLVVSIYLITISLVPNNFINNKKRNNIARNNKIENAKVFKNLSDSIAKNYIIFNLNSLEEIELMFFKESRAYSWPPSEPVLDSLLKAGEKVACFEHPDRGISPYIRNNPSVLIIPIKIY